MTDLTAEAASIVAATYDDLSPDELAALGRERGASAALPPIRGTYTFRLPTLTPASFKTVTRRVFEAGQDTGRVTEYFEISRDHMSLTIEDGPEAIGDAFPWGLSAVPRRRKIGFGPAAKMVSVSDAQLLVVSGFRVPSPRTPSELKAALLKLSEKIFKARIVYTSNCNPKRDAFFPTAEEGRFAPRQYDTLHGEDGTATPVNVKGCGATLWNSAFRAVPTAKDEGSRKGVYASCPGYQSAVTVDGTRYTLDSGGTWAELPEDAPEDAGKWLCGARIRAFTELEGFSPADTK